MFYYFIITLFIPGSTIYVKCVSWWINNFKIEIELNWIVILFESNRISESTKGPRPTGLPSHFLTIWVGLRHTGILNKLFTLTRLLSVWFFWFFRRLRDGPSNPQGNRYVPLWRRTPPVFLWMSARSTRTHTSNMTYV